MGQIVTLRERVWQPQYPVRLRAQWAKIIAFASVSGQDWNLDLKSGVFPAIVPLTQIDHKPTPYGMASVPTSASAGYKWSAQKPIANMGDGYAILTVACPVSEAQLSRMVAVGTEQAVDGYNAAQLIFNSTKTASAQAGIFASTEYSGGFKATAESIASQVDGGWHVFLVNRIAGASAPALYRDGVNVTNTTTNTAGVAFTTGVEVHCAPSSTTQGSRFPSTISIVFNRPLTAAEIALFKQPNDVWQIFQPLARTIYSFSAAGAHTIALNQVSETETPQTFATAKRLSFGQNAETNLAQAMVHAKSAALGQIPETDTPQAFGHAKQFAFGQTSETDTAQPIQVSGSKIISLGQVPETDAPQIFVSLKQKAFGQSSEADASTTLSPGRLYPFAQASETDADQAFAKTKRAALNEVSESDTAQPIQASGTKIIALGQVTESEFAQALAHFKVLGILQASETDDVFAMAASKAKSIGQAQETDAALNFGGTGIPPYEVLATAYQPRTRRAEYEPRVKRIPR